MSRRDERLALGAASTQNPIQFDFYGALNLSYSSSNSQTQTRTLTRPGHTTTRPRSLQPAVCLPRSPCSGLWKSNQACACVAASRRLGKPHSLHDFGSRAPRENWREVTTHRPGLTWPDRALFESAMQKKATHNEHNGKHDQTRSNTMASSHNKQHLQCTSSHKARPGPRATPHQDTTSGYDEKASKRWQHQ